MLFYLGKELYESNRPFEAIGVLEKAAKKTDIENHDRLLAYQYASYSCMACAQLLKPELVEDKKSYFKRAIDFAVEGMKFDPNRAEFHVAIGDCLIQIGELARAVPYFAAAKHCINPKANGSPYEGALYNFLNCYGEIPSLQLAKVYFHLGQIEKAKKEAQECIDLYKNEEAKTILAEVEKIEAMLAPKSDQQDVPDIVFSCPPQSVYEFDEELYKTKGMGGSETALIEMARNLKELTGRPVKVFNMREKDLVAESGVEYISNRTINEYLSKYKPAAHIAWRHNIKITPARTYLWCHDLSTPSVEVTHNFDKHMCLSEFHKDYIMGLQGVPEEKIVVTRNGINPEKFKFEKKPKNPNKVVWMSSPDRGLDRCMHVMDELRKEFPELELHVYYGLENLYKYGLNVLAEKLKAMMAERPWVKYHGFTEQNKMYREVSDAVLWLHPCNFIETFCITALEMLNLGVFPVTRRLGGLQNTLSEAERLGQAVMLDHDCITQEQILAYRDAAADVLRNKRWENVFLDTDKYSWKSVAEEWRQFMEL